MKKNIFVIVLVLFASFSSFAQKNYLLETLDEKTKRMEWWRDATFGMFIHWGIYSVPAGEYKGKGGGAEWIMESHKIPIPEYELFAKQFNPTKFNAKEWVKIAKAAGIKYIVITSKHHDGFCLWDSKVSDYDIMDAAPFKRDILKELSAACKAEGIAFGLYHSILDWHQPDAKSKDYPHQATQSPDFQRYKETYLKPQLVEILQNYDPAILWFDGEWIPEWNEEWGKELYNFLRNIKPNLIINNRIGKGRAGMQGMNKYENAAGDFGTPEQEILEIASSDYWESCMTLNDHWGYSKEDNNWKSSAVLIDNLNDIAAKGGNFLLNVGPTSEGLIPQPSIERLAEMGKWAALNQEAIFATNGIKHFKEGENVKFTQSKDERFIYAFVKQIAQNQLKLKTIQPVKGSKITLLGTNEDLNWTYRNKTLTIQIPSRSSVNPHGIVLKIEGKSIGKGIAARKEETIKVKHKGIGAAAQFVEVPNELYGADRQNGLIDGILASKQHNDGKWYGWFGKDLEVVLDLKKAKKISYIGLHCLQDSKSWIVFPKKVEFLVSSDNVNWKSLGKMITNADATNQELMQKTFELNFNSEKVRYVKVKATYFGELPQNHIAAGNKAWLFADEVMVR